MRFGAVRVEIIRGPGDGSGAVAVEALCAVAHAVDAAVGREVLLDRGLQSTRVPRQTGTQAGVRVGGQI